MTDWLPVGVTLAGGTLMALGMGWLALSGGVNALAWFVWGFGFALILAMLGSLMFAPRRPDHHYYRDEDGQVCCSTCGPIQELYGPTGEERP